LILPSIVASATTAIVVGGEASRDIRARVSQAVIRTRD